MNNTFFTLVVITLFASTGCFSPTIEKGTILITTPVKVYSDQVAVEVSHTDVSFSLKNQTDSQQEILLIAELFDDNDKSVGMARRRIPVLPAQIDTDIQLSLTPIFHPRLWSPLSPYNHLLRLEVWKSGKHLMAKEEVPYGFSSLQFENDAVLFNRLRMPLTFEIVNAPLEKNQQIKNTQTSLHVFILNDSSLINQESLQQYNKWGLPCMIPVQSDSTLWGNPCVIALYTQELDNIELNSKQADLAHKRFVLLLDNSLPIESLHDATKKVDAIFVISPKQQSKYAEKPDWIRPIYYSPLPTVETETP